MKHIRTTIAKLMAAARGREVHQFRPDPRFEKYQDVPSYFTSEHFLKLSHRADWHLTDARLIKFSDTLRKRMRDMQIPVYVHTAYRSPTLQKKLRDMGHSQLSDGPHQRGAAVDIVHAHFHWKAGDDYWALSGRIGKEIASTQGLKLDWGGDWKKFYDPAHWQFTDWRMHITNLEEYNSND